GGHPPPDPVPTRLGGGGSSQGLQRHDAERPVRLRCDRFQRPPDSPPGTPWVPKAILSVSQFNGDGTVSTPMITIANPPFVPFDSGGIFAPPAGSDGTYTLNDDCSGTIQYS